MILDGGSCRVGIESTVLDLTGARPVILRPGGVSRRQIEEAIGPVELAAAVSPGAAAPGPGMQAEHYRPLAPMFRFEADQADKVAQWCADHAGRKAAILVMPSHGGIPGHGREHLIVVMPGETDPYANRLYATLHDADRMGVSVIWVQMPPDAPEWAAVRDRLRRASKPV
jgi:L-threonylcarbamoyladenylate synthase